MNMNTIDLHNHSGYSVDGEFKPNELVDIAISRGIKYISVSDHDDVRALDEALGYAKDKKITVIPGIEITAIIDNYPLHILGYGINYHAIEFRKRHEQVASANKDFASKALKKAHDFGFEFNDEEVYALREDGLICEEMIGTIILNDQRNNNNIHLKEFRADGEYSDNPPFNFYKVFFTKGKPLNVPYEYNMPIAEATKLIHENGGKMFLAHPAHNIGHDEEILKKIISYGLDGIEVFSSYHSKDDINFFYEKAKKYNLYMSVGSDFHGKAKPSIMIGSIDYDEEELKKTIEFLTRDKV